MPAVINPEDVQRALDFLNQLAAQAKEAEVLRAEIAALRRELERADARWDERTYQLIDMSEQEAEDAE